MRWLLLLVVVACTKARADFPDSKTFQAEQKKAGYVVLGTFTPIVWPAKIVAERVEQDRISFTRPNGTPHNYSGYGGYTLKLVRLRGADGEEAVRLFRSQAKR